MINRTLYLNKLRMYKDKHLIKVVSGIRRAGKSTLLQIFKGEIIGAGVDERQTISLNFEDLAYRDILTAEAAYDYIQSRLLSDRMNYIFLDEVQNVAEFERMVDSLFIKENVDLYITGSNAYFLSSDLATVLTGRYIQIHMFPLSFAEYVSEFDDTTNLAQLYASYINYGSFPQALELFLDSPEAVKPYIQSIYDTVLFKDIVARKSIRQEGTLQDIAKFVFDNIGNPTNPHRIATSLTAAGRKVSNHTVEDYMTALTDSFVLYRADRYDVKGKHILQTQQKYYCVDLAFRQLLSKTLPTDYGRMLENVVFLELLRRYDKVMVGKFGVKEIDFVAVLDDEVHYYQIALSVREDATRERELAAFPQDHHAKFLLTLDPEEGNIHGIKQLNALNWLVKQ
ncbi:MAG TPA: ATP-binding protein [Candidatus Saccharibacteria bacterium]|nr:ATP-binding protein [Candidatus Saccharibacteria bacterium]HMR38102.1 ATP-binding protein [Candidatus Saccharibacteria bacterium]